MSKLELNKKWKKIIIVWFAIGIGIAGVLRQLPIEIVSLNTPQQFKQEQKAEMFKGFSNIALVVVVSGLIIIGGFAHINSEEKD